MMKNRNWAMVVAWGCIIFIFSVSCSTQKTYKDFESRLKKLVEYNRDFRDSDADGVVDFLDIEPGEMAFLEAMPSFEFPPPPFTKIENDFLTNLFPGTKTFGEVDSILSIDLHKAGYDDHYTHFKVVKGESAMNQRFLGWAIVTDFERIDDEGNLLTDRWSSRVDPGRSWFGLFNRTGKGLFRLFAFVITNEEFTTNETLERTKEEIRQQLNSNISTQEGLPEPLKKYEFDDAFKLHVLVYEFYQYENDADGYYLEIENLPLKTQLQKVGINLFK